MWFIATIWALQRAHLQLHLCQALRQAQQCPLRLQRQRQRKHRQHQPLQLHQHLFHWHPRRPLLLAEYRLGKLQIFTSSLSVDQ